MRNVSKIVLAAAFVLAARVPAQAQFGFGNNVYDPTNYGEAVAEFNQLTQQLTQLQQANTQLQQTYSAIAHLPDTALNSIGSGLNVSEFRNPLSLNSGAMASAVSGASLASGAIGGLASSFQQQNHVYLPTNNNPATTALAANANSIANTQATASTFYQSSVDHVTALQQLESELSGATDEKAVADIQARIQLEQAYLTAQQIQIMTLSMMQDAQKRNQTQQAEENRQLSISNALSSLAGN